MTAQPDQPGSTEPVVTPLRAPAGTMRTRKRHVAAILAFFAIVLAPVAGTAWYLYGIAADQYASTVGFSVRKEDFSSPIELFGGVTDFGSSGTSDSDILYEFIQSQQMVETLEDRIGLSDIFARPENDPVFAFDESGSVEDLHRRWRWMTRVTYDAGTELIEVRALAFTPEDARLIAQAVFDESAALIVELSEIARDDTTRFAEDEVARSVERLKLARQSMSDFRSRTQIVDPAADLQGQMGLLSTLEGQLAEALIAADLLRENAREGDTRVSQADKRIEIIERRIAEERRKLGVGAGEEGVTGDYATILTEYESLAVDREFAEQSYVAALATYDQAQAEARRKSRYLAAYIKPTLSEKPQFPKRAILLSVTAFFLLTLWGVAMLVFYSIRDRR